MVKLEIVQRDEYVYSLKDDNGNKYDMNLEFIDVEDKINIGNYIYMHAELLNPRYAGFSTIYTFGSLNNKYGKENLSIGDIDVIKLEIGKREIYLKRLYG